MRDTNQLFIFSRLSAFKIECSNLIIIVGVSDQTTFSSSVTLPMVTKQNCVNYVHCTLLPKKHKNNCEPRLTTNGQYGRTFLTPFLYDEVKQGKKVDNKLNNAYLRLFVVLLVL
jgi:hypothetical protein